MTHPPITVLVPTFNRAEFISQCLDSLLAQTLPPCQLLVINDGSTDGTARILDGYGGRIERIDTAQLGKPASLNCGLKKARGEYVWIFDDDDVALPDALERFVEPLQTSDSYDFSFSTFWFTENDARTNRLGRVLYELKHPDFEKRGFLPVLLESNFLGGAALFARTRCYRELGAFDEKLFRSQDYEMAIRFARRFKGVRIRGGPTFHYRQHRGLRGSAQDRFAADRQLKKWLDYDQLFFRKLYGRLPESDYLPAGGDPQGQKRQMLLQRLTIMASKLLTAEVLADLDALAELNDTRTFSRNERAIVESLVSAQYHRAWNLLSMRELPRELRRRSRTSGGIRLLRKEIARALVIRIGKRPLPGRLLSAGRQWFGLYLG